MMDCKFIAPCAHTNSGLTCARVNCGGVNYTNSLVRDILLLGIYNIEIRCKVLSNPSMLKLINDIICTVEGNESARNFVNAPYH